MRIGSPQVRALHAARAAFAMITLCAAVALPARSGHADGAAPAERLAPVYPRGWPVQAPGADKFQHASLSLTLGLGIGIGSRSARFAFTGAFAFGIAKELRDRRHSRFDPVDLAADLAGATLAAVITAAILR